MRTTQGHQVSKSTLRPGQPVNDVFVWLEVTMMNILVLVDASINDVG